MSEPPPDTLDLALSPADELEPATNYHETIDDLRRTLLRASEAHQEICQKYMGLFKELRPEPVDEPVDGHAAAVSAAVVGNQMASSCSYLLAALLRVAHDQFGYEVARMLAFEVDELLNNGDFEDMNGDLSATGS